MPLFQQKKLSSWCWAAETDAGSGIRKRMFSNPKTKACNSTTKYSHKAPCVFPPKYRFDRVLSNLLRGTELGWAGETLESFHMSRNHITSGRTHCQHMQDPQYHVPGAVGTTQTCNLPTERCHPSPLSCYHAQTIREETAHYSAWQQNKEDKRTKWFQPDKMSFLTLFLCAASGT